VSSSDSPTCSSHQILRASITILFGTRKRLPCPIRIWLFKGISVTIHQISIVQYKASRLESPALMRVELIVQLLCLCLDLITKLDASIMVVADRLVHRLQPASCVENQLLSQHRSRQDILASSQHYISGLTSRENTMKASPLGFLGLTVAMSIWKVRVTKSHLFDSVSI
jgi:hypothetical protein